MLPLEHCCLCDAETDRAGRADDSIYIIHPDGNEIGPLCETCYLAFCQAFDACKTSLAEVGAAQTPNKQRRRKNENERA